VPTIKELIPVSGGDDQTDQKRAEKMKRSVDSLERRHEDALEKAEIKNLPSASQKTRNIPTTSNQEVTTAQAVSVPTQHGNQRSVDEDSSEEEPLALKKKGRKKKTVPKKNDQKSKSEVSSQELQSPKKKPRKVVATKAKKPLTTKAKKVEAKRSSKISTVNSIEDQSNDSRSDDIPPVSFTDDVTPISPTDDAMRASDAENIQPSSESEANPMQRSVNANKSVSFHDVVDVCEYDDQEMEEDDWLSQLEQKKEEVVEKNKIVNDSSFNLTVAQKKPVKIKEAAHPKLPAKTKVNAGRKATKLSKPEKKKTARFVE